MARLAEAADERHVARLQEDDLHGRAPRRECGRGLLDRGRRITGADVEHQRNAVVPGLVGVAERQEAVQQLRRQVIDAVIAKILEELRGLALAGAGEPADDDQLARPWTARPPPRRPIARMTRASRPSRGARPGSPSPWVVPLVPCSIRVLDERKYSPHAPPLRPPSRPRTVAAAPPDSASRSYPPSSVSATPPSPSRAASSPSAAATAS